VRTNRDLLQMCRPAALLRSSPERGGRYAGQRGQIGDNMLGLWCWGYIRQHGYL